MQRIRHTLLLCCLLLCGIAAPLAPAGAQTSTSRYIPGVTAEGAVYYLPRTAIRVAVRVEKTTVTPGIYCQYAQRYLRLADAPQQSSVTYRILGVEQQPLPIPDPQKAYAVKFNPASVASNIILSPEGLLLGINTPAEPLPAYQPFKAAPRQPAVDARRFLTPDILAAGSVAKQAELTADEIYDLRDNRSLLIKGQADFNPKDGQQLRLMLDEMDRQDQALTSLFQGTIVRDTTERLVTIVPNGPVQKHLLFRFSQKLGLVDDDDLAGVPYYIYVSNETTLPEPDPSEKEKAKKPKLVESGIYVNVPGRLRSTIFVDGDELSTQLMPAPQFGRVELLSGALFNKRFTTRLLLNPLSGAVERLEAEQPGK